ncbi:MAG: C39 family peptidase [Chromatocurvus sp.]
MTRAARRRGLHTYLLPLLMLLVGPFFCMDNAVGKEREFRDWKTRRDQGVVRQERDFSCGVAAMATLLTYYFERPVSEEQLLARLDLPDPDVLTDAISGAGVTQQERERLLALQERGVSLAMLAGLAREYGLVAKGIKISPALLSRLSVPAIAYVEPRGEPHFTLIRGVDGYGNVQVADPSWGNRRFPAADFARVFVPPGAVSGRLLIVLPDSHEAGLSEDRFGVDRPQPLMQPLNQPFGLAP